MCDTITTKLSQYRKRSRNLLYAIMPKHVASMIQSGVHTYNLCEVYCV
jgi:hypothetical protein